VACDQPSTDQGTAPVKRELTFELERPKPPPKLEPPKRRAKLQRPAKCCRTSRKRCPIPIRSRPQSLEESPIAVRRRIGTPAASARHTGLWRAGYLNNPPPAYPAVASRLGLQGTVLLRVVFLATVPLPVLKS